MFSPSLVTFFILLSSWIVMCLMVKVGCKSATCRRVFNNEWTVPKWLFVVVLGLFFVYFATLNWLGYSNFHFHDRDFAANLQAIWKLSEGMRPFATIFQRHYLADHWWPIFQGLALFYKVIPHPMLILTLNIIAFLVGVCAVYQVAKRYIPESILCAAVAFNLLMHPYIHMALIGRSNSDVYSFMFIALSFWCLMAKRYRLFILPAFLALCCKEDVALYFVAIGCWMWFVEKKRALGLKIALCSMVYFLCVTMIFMPMLNNGEKPHNFALYYGHFGDSIGAILHTIVFQPWLVLDKLIGFDSLYSLVYLCGPFLLFIFLGGRGLLLAMPPVFIKLLTIRSDMFFFSKHHIWHPLFFLYFAVIIGVLFCRKLLIKRFQFSHCQATQVLSLVLVVMGILSATQYSSLIEKTDFTFRRHYLKFVFPVNPLFDKWWAFQETKRSRLYKEAYNLIPETSGSVFAEMAIHSYNPNRYRIYELNRYHRVSFCCALESVEYGLFDFDVRDWYETKAVKELKAAVLTYFQAHDHWSLEYSKEGIMLYKRLENMMIKEGHDFPQR